MATMNAARVMSLVAFVGMLTLFASCNNAPPNNSPASQQQGERAPGIDQGAVAATPVKERTFESLAEYWQKSPPKLPGRSENLLTGEQTISAQLKRLGNRRLATSCNAKPDLSGTPPEKGIPWPRSLFSPENVRCSSIAISPAQTLVVAGDQAGRIHFWATICASDESYSNEPIATFRDHSSNVTALAFSSDGRQLVSGDDDGNILFRDVDTGRILRRSKPNDRTIHRLTLSAKGDYLHVHAGPFAFVYDVQTMEPIWSVEFLGKGCVMAAGAPWLAVMKDDALEIRDFRTDTLKHRLPLGGRWVSELAFSDDGNTLVVIIGQPIGVEQDQVVTIDVTSGKIQNRFPTRQFGTAVLAANGAIVFCPEISRCHLASTTRLSAENYRGSLTDMLATEGLYAFIGVDDIRIELLDVATHVNFPMRRAIDQLWKTRTSTLVERGRLKVSVQRVGTDLSSLLAIPMDLELEVNADSVSIDPFDITGQSRPTRPTFEEQLPLLAQLPRLVSLRFPYNFAVSNEFLVHLGKLSKLQRLEMPKSEEVSDESAVHFRGLTSLKVLDISGTSLSDDGLKHLSKLNSLEKLKLPKGIGDAGLQHLASLDQLTELSLPASQVSDEGLKHLTKMSRMKRLTIATGRVQGAGLAHLAAMKELESFELTNSKILDDAGLACLPRWQRLKKLNLHDSPQLTTAAIRSIARLPNLEELSLSWCTKMTAKEFSHLCDLKNLKGIDIYHCQAMTGAGLEALAKVPGITSLSLSGTPIDNEGFKSIAAIKQLKQLSIDENTTDEGLVLLGGLPHLEELKHSSLPKVQGLGLIALARATKLPTLDLQKCQPTESLAAALVNLPDVRDLTLPDGAGNAFIWQMVQLPGLESLTVENGKFAADSLKELSRLKVLSSLTLQNCRLTDKDLIYLKDVANLSVLHLDGNACTQAEIDALLNGSGKYSTSRGSVRIASSGCPFESVNFAPDGRSLVCVTRDELKVVDVAKAKLRFEQPLEMAFLRAKSIVFSSDSKSFLMRGRNGGLTRIDLATGELIDTVPLDFELSSLDEMRISDDGSRYVAETGDDLAMGNFPARKSKLVRCLPKNPYFVEMEPDGRWCVTGDGPRMVLWDLDEQRQVKDWWWNENVESCRLARGGRLLAIEGGNVTTMRDVATDEVLWKQHVGGLKFMFTPDGKRLICTGYFGKPVYVLDAWTGRVLRSFKTQTDEAGAFGISPNGHTLVTAGNGQLTFWDVPSLEPKK